MKIVVDLSICQGHSQCEEAAPEIFQVREGENGYQSVVVNASPDETPSERSSRRRSVAARRSREALSISD